MMTVRLPCFVELFPCLLPRSDFCSAGTYKLNGTKIWISAGEHDLTPNIVHIVLARLPGAPEVSRIGATIRFNVRSQYLIMVACA